MKERFWLSPLPVEKKGLSREEAASRLRLFGPNVILQASKGEGLRQVLAFFANPLVLILSVSAILAGFFGETVNAILITSVILASVGLNFIQTFHSQRAADTLRKRVVNRARVMRDGDYSEIPFAEVVPGDLFLLSAGDLVPADGRLLEAKDLYADQASLTGESLPVEKQAGELSEKGIDQASNAVFAGTSIVSGTGRAIAERTGSATAFGSIASALTRQPPPTEFEHGMLAFSFLILRVVIALVLFVFLVLAFSKHEPLEAFLFAIALAVGLTPEFLPMIISVTLARGALRMAEKKVIVKQLQAIENFGSIDVLCCDKTGTLTEGKLALAQAIDGKGNPSEEVRLKAFLNSENESGIRSSLDEAILAAPHPEPPPCHKLDEIPFDFQRRRLSVVLELDGKRLLITKGAPESVLAVSSAYRLDGEIFPLDAEGQALIERTYRKLSLEGLRLLAIAEKEVSRQASYEEAEEKDLVFVGFAAFLDPPRSDIRETLRAIRADGIRVVILTGDNEWVTKKICSEVGMDGEEVMLGQDLDLIRPEALPHIAERFSIFARLNPEQKDRVVRALKAGGHVVGFLGDGINDAPSLRTADVGISVDSAVDVAKEAAPIILMDKSLQVLHQGVLEGRRSFANIVKYLMMGTSSNFGNMFSMAGASSILPFLPMLPVQILLNNLLYDVSQLTIPGDRVDEDAVRHPRRWKIRFIQHFMFAMGPVSSLFDFLTFYVLLKFFHADQALFHTGWFVESLLTQTLVIFVIRTRKNPFQSRPSLGLSLSVPAACMAAMLIPFTPAGRTLGFVPPPIELTATILGMTAVYLFLAEGMKNFFYARLEKEPE